MVPVGVRVSVWAAKCLFRYQDELVEDDSSEGVSSMIFERKLTAQSCRMADSNNEVEEVSHELDDACAKKHWMRSTVQSLQIQLTSICFGIDWHH